MTATISADPNPVDAGKELIIEFNGGTANGTVTLELDNGGSLTDTIQIQLDANGKGSAGWTVPASGWSIVNINGGGADQESVIVTP